ncbi:hypothetical protein CBER1_08092 [Cercospora berteroae]|uniref:Uncharacterized protein n=1 Tax=Cercospora berteroae TaxID=357750 RepID=A0A2S6CF71_9PEZI|nr:hypothetical protein CBER1_08092 [Cercospora berteroae]
MATDLILNKLESWTPLPTQLENSGSPLLRLPGELRNAIWRMALVQDIEHQVATLSGGRPARPSNLQAPNPNTCTSWGWSSQLHGSLDQIRPPQFLNACRQTKLEIESILYTEIMIFEEYDNVLKKWKVLEPYQLGSLFDTRRFGLPLFSTHHVCKPRGETARQVIEKDQKGERSTLMHLRKGMVRFAEELGLESLEWRLGPSHLIDVEVQRLGFSKRWTVTARGMQP